MERLLREPSAFVAPSRRLKTPHSDGNFLGVSKKFSLPFSNAAVVEIERGVFPNTWIPYPKPTDYSETLRFKVKLNRKNLKDLLTLAESEFHQRFSHLTSVKFDATSFKGSHLHERGSSPRVIISQSILYRQLEEFVSLAMLAHNVANPFSYCPRICTVRLTNNPNGAAHHFDFRDFHSPENVQLEDFELIFSNLRIEMEAAKQRGYSQLTRGISYFFNALKQGDNHASALIYCISGLESLLSKPAERVSKDALSSRLLLLLKDELTASLRSDFDLLYKFRNKFFHGSTNLVMLIEGAGHEFNFFEEDKMLYPEFQIMDMANISFKLLSKVIKKYLVESWTELNFSLSVAGR